MIRGTVVNHQNFVLWGKRVLEVLHRQAEIQAFVVRDRHDTNFDICLGVEMHALFRSYSL